MKVDIDSSDINHLSDTAIWVGAYRAEESDRTDALFKDPYVKKLVGDRGKKIVAAMPLRKSMAFTIIIRNVTIDRLLEISISNGVDTVLNLGAGFDTRPYRMKLPASLRWIEVDFPHMIKYKSEILSQDKPVCRLERVSLDLTEAEERRKLFSRVDSQSKCVLVLTEGVISYLSNEQAANLAKEIFRSQNFHYWIQDYYQNQQRDGGSKKISKMLKNAPFRFDVPDTLKFFEVFGWRVKMDLKILDEAERVGRSLPFTFPWGMLARVFPKIVRKIGNSRYGCVLFQRASLPID